MENEQYFEVDHLTKFFPVKKRGQFFGKPIYVHAVDDVQFTVRKGKTYGVVGESGCGKTTLARMIMHLEKPTSGRMLFKGQDITLFNGKQMKALRRQMQMVFQDPFGSLNPVRTIRNIVAEPVRVHHIFQNRQDEKIKVQEMLETVGLSSSDEMLEKRPGQLSGGERQRVGIASALILGAEFIVADEPVSMLDASIRADIIALMMKLKEEKNLTYFFITHEFGMARAICDRIAVMYAGKMVEVADAASIVDHPLHPYTQLLIDAIPPLIPDPNWGKNISEGEVPYFTVPPPGCRYHPRCSRADELCKSEIPELVDYRDGHFAACHHV
ncbi:MAG: ABC transporter ATP-binding protein [Chloroflexi bacterium]|nr:ABC transporter ATP-binding protein [Chloroflexota bacterium]MBT7081304.1 ABC transporter ATP-binding protein [Chloroflexota bacterium]